MADLQLPPGTASTIPVTLNATNTPVGTTFSVRVMPSSGLSTTFTTLLSTGSFANSSATSTIDLAPGQINVITAYASFIIPEQIAWLLPEIKGEEIERVMLASNMGQASDINLVTKSGKILPAKEVLKKEQLTLLWQGMMLQK